MLIRLYFEILSKIIAESRTWFKGKWRERINIYRNRKLTIPQQHGRYMNFVFTVARASLWFYVKMIYFWKIRHLQKSEY